MSTILEVKEDCGDIERELNKYAIRSIKDFERKHGVSLKISFSSDYPDKMFDVYFEGSSKTYKK